MATSTAGAERATRSASHQNLRNTYWDESGITLRSIRSEMAPEEKLQIIERAAMQFLKESKKYATYKVGCFGSTTKLGSGFIDQRVALMEGFAAVLKSIPDLKAGDQEHYQYWLQNPNIMSVWWHNDPAGLLTTPRSSTNTLLEGAYRALKWVEDFHVRVSYVHQPLCRL